MCDILHSVKVHLQNVWKYIVMKRFKGAPCRVRLLRCNVTVPWWSWNHPDMVTAGHWWVSPVVSGLKRVADHLSATVKQLHLSDLKGIICTTASKNGSYKTLLSFRWTLPLLKFHLQIFVLILSKTSLGLGVYSQSMKPDLPIFEHDMIRVRHVHYQL